MNNLMELRRETGLTECAPVDRDAFQSEPCIDLWFAVIRTALHDLALARRLGDHDELSKSDQGLLREIRSHSPGDFFEGPWFREICDYLDVDPAVAWEDLGLEAHGLQGQPPTCHAA